ncbi:MAG: hypothetical protein AAB116_15735 [Candidatus Poribacteria bacterium]
MKLRTAAQIKLEVCHLHLQVYSYFEGKYAENASVTPKRFDITSGSLSAIIRLSVDQDRGAILGYASRNHSLDSIPAPCGTTALSSRGYGRYLESHGFSGRPF